MLNLSNLISTIQYSQKTLFILCGYPYSGKSYIANQLRLKTNIQTISIDDIFNTKGFNWDTNTLPNEIEWQEIFNESYEKTKTILIQGKNVLYDSTNQTIESRKKLRTLACSLGANFSIVYIKTSPGTVWKRWTENKKQKSRSTLSKSLVQKTIDMFEVPKNNEAEIYTICND